MMFRTNIGYSGTKNNARMGSGVKTSELFKLNPDSTNDCQVPYETITVTLTLKIVHKLTISIKSIFPVLYFRTPVFNVITFKNNNKWVIFETLIFWG
jgi:hypothetical protein